MFVLKSIYTNTFKSECLSASEANCIYSYEHIFYIYIHVCTYIKDTSLVSVVTFTELKSNAVNKG